MTKTQIKVNALVELLDRHERHALETLRQRYPSDRELLTVGTVMGSGATQSLSPNAVYLDLAIGGLRTAQARVEPNIQRLRARLQNAKRIRLIGQIIGAVTSAGLIAAILGEWRTPVTITTALINFGAVLCTLMYGGKGSLIDSFETLATTSVEAEEVIQTLQVFARSPPEESRVMEQVSRANAIANKLRLAERMLWGA
jgi:hypothetical protein